MKNIIIVLLIGSLSSLITSEQVGATASFVNDYVLQDRFNKSLSKAKKGIAKAQYRVGEMLEKGRGTDTDLKQAFDWYQKAAEQRHIKAQYKLGYMRYEGVGVEKDIKKAFIHLQKPADKGYVRAQYYLGKLYANGHGVIKDPKKALMWYSRASLGGYTPADEELATLKKLVTEVERADKNNHRSKTARIIKLGKADINNQTYETDTIKTRALNLDKIIKKILLGGWTNRKRPSEFLPSRLTQCEKTSDAIMECLSRKLSRNNGSADIYYITKALLYDINDNGEFKVAYRNNVLNIIRHEQTSEKLEEIKNTKDIEDADDDEQKESSPQRSTIKKGWQETEHHLVCKIKNKNSINCLKNKIRKLVYNRKI